MHICEIYALKYVQNVLTKDYYLTCNHGKCCEFHVICPCIVRKVQNLRHSLYISWSSLDGLLVCLLWCCKLLKTGFATNYANILKLFLPCWALKLVFSSSCSHGLPGFLVPRRALLFWGIFVRGFARRDLC